MTTMSCPDRERLHGYLVGTLPEEQAEAVAAHLTSCARCRRTVDALEGLPDAMIGALRQTADRDAYGNEPEYKEALQRLRALPNQPPILEALRADSGSSKGRPPKPPRIPKLGDYELLSKLGEGGMGTVYKARHARMKRIVALKVLPKERLSDEEAIGRFEQEMEAVGRLDHPNIVRALDARKIGETHLLAMEYIDGLDLSKVVKRHGPLSIPDACEVVRQAARGLACSHENNLVHRDIKPSNLMLNSTGQVKILDLGLAQIQEAETLGGSGTGAGLVMGTPDYMSPEQASGSQTVDIRSDLYALGCTLYYLLTGHPPFNEPEYDAPMKKVTAHIRDAVPPVLSVRPDVPQPVAKLLENMVVKDLSARAARPDDVANTLAPFCKGAKLISLLREASQKEDEHDGAEGRIETGELRASAMVDTSSDDLGEDRGGHQEGTDFDPYHRWLGIPPEQQPANHYRLLGLACFEADPEVIRDAALRQMSHVRGYHLGQHSELSQKVLGELAAAKKCLLDPRRKAEYDARLRRDASPSAVPPPGRLRSAPLRSLARAMSTCFSGRRSKLPPVIGITAGFVGLVALFATVLYVTTAKGTIKITLSDPKASVEVKIDGNHITLSNLESPILLRPGEHELVVTGKGYETVCRSFTVRRGGNPVCTVELVPSARPVPDEPPQPTQSESAPIDKTDGLYDSLVKVAAEEYHLQHFDRAASLLDDLLDEVPSSIQNWEWGYLTSLCRPELHCLPGHKYTMYWAIYSPDSRFLATTGRGSVIKVRDAKVGRDISSTSGHSGPVGGMMFSPDATTLISQDPNGTLVFWDLPACTKTRTIPPIGNPPLAFRGFSPDGQCLLMTNGDGTLLSCAIADGKEVSSFKGHTDSIRLVVFDSKGERLAAGCQHGEIVVWDYASGAKIASFKGHEKEIWSLAFSPNQGELISNDGAGTTRRWNLATGEQSHCAETPAGCLSPDGKWLVASGRGEKDRVVRVYDTWTGRQLFSLHRHFLAFRGAAFSPDGQQMATVAGWYIRCGLVRIWHVPTELSRRTFRKRRAGLSRVAFDADGKRIISAGADGHVLIHDTLTDEGLLHLQAHTGAVHDVAVSARLGRIATAGADKRVRLWDSATGQHKQTIEGFDSPVFAVAFSSDGRYLATASENGSVELREAKSGRHVRSLNGHEGAVYDVVFSPDGHWIASAGTDKSIVLCDAATGKSVRTLRGHEGTIHELAFDPEGRWIASASDDKRIGIWDTTTGEQIRFLQGHGDAVRSLAVSPDGKRLVSASNDKSIRVWNVHTGQELLVLTGHEGAIQSVAFSPDGKRIVSGGDDQFVKVWDSTVYSSPSTQSGEIADESPIRPTTFFGDFRPSSPPVIRPKDLAPEASDPRATDTVAPVSAAAPVDVSTLDREISVDLGDGVRMEFVLIPAGAFMMGAPDSDSSAAEDQKPLHKVTISRPFYLGKHEVTQAQWEATQKENPSKHVEATRPVENISWNDCQAFIAKLNHRYRTSGAKFGLPTEAQWEYACRAGNQGRFCFGDDEARLTEYAWFGTNSRNTTHPVGLKKPNRWGLYDMHGNVWEWCADVYDSTYYTTSPTVDPARTDSEGPRVLRGGSYFGQDPGHVRWRSHFRKGGRLQERRSMFGLRLAMTAVRMGPSTLDSSSSTNANSTKERTASDREGKHSDEKQSPETPAAAPIADRIARAAESSDVPESGESTDGADAAPKGADIHAGEQYLDRRWVDLLPDVELPRDVVSGDWRHEGTRLKVGPKPWARVMLPMVVLGGYDLHVEFTRESGDEAINLSLPAGKTTCNLILSAARGNYHSLEVIENQYGTKSPAHITPGPLTNGHRYKVDVQVRLTDDRISISSQLDGKPLLSWVGKQGSISDHCAWQLSDPRRLGLGAYDSPVTFHKARIRRIFPSDLKSLDGHFYKVIDTPMTWHLAQEYCERMGGHLVRIESEKEQSFVRQMLDDSKGGHWINGTDVVKEGEWRFANGQQMAYTNWLPGQPDNWLAREHYLNIAPNKEGRWYDGLGGWRFPFICEWESRRYLSTRPAKRTKSRVEIPKGSLSWKGHHYLRVDEPMTYDYARKWCAAHGGHLVQIDSREEQETIEQLIRSSKCEWYFLDGSDARSEGTWETHEGTQLKFVNWDEHQPDNGREAEHYVAISNHTYDGQHYGRWHDMPRESKSGFICEWDQ